MNAWDNLSLTEKSDMIRVAVENGITTLPEIRKAYNEFAEGGGVDTINTYETDGYKPSENIKSRIAHYEGKAMTGARDPISGKWGKNSSFEAEARGFYKALPVSIREQVLSNPELADSLYSYSYNVGAGNFKKRVVPALERYYAGIGSVKDIEDSMWATHDNKLRGLQRRRAEEKAGVRNALMGEAMPLLYTEQAIPEFTPFNPQAFSAFMGVDGNYEDYIAPQVVDVEEPLVQAAMESAYSPEQIEREERAQGLRNLGLAMSIMRGGQSPAESSSLWNTVGLLTGSQYKNGGKIHIKPENRGKFTALKKRTGHSATWFKEHGTPAQKKMATFALNSRHWKHGLGGNLFSGEDESTQQMQNGLNLYRRTNNLGETEYIYQETPDSEEILLTPTNKRFSDDPTNWDYKDASGRKYSPRMTTTYNPGEIREDTRGPLERMVDNYFGELKYQVNNNVPISGEYTMPAIAAAPFLAWAGEAAYPYVSAALANPYVDAGLTSAFAGHGLNHAINEGIDGYGDAFMTALELTPLGRVAKPMWNASKEGLQYTAKVADNAARYAFPSYDLYRTIGETTPRTTPTLHSFYSSDLTGSGFVENVYTGSPLFEFGQTMKTSPEKAYFMRAPKDVDILKLENGQFRHEVVGNEILPSGEVNGKFVSYGEPWKEFALGENSALYEFPVGPRRGPSLMATDWKGRVQKYSVDEVYDYMQQEEALRKELASIKETMGDDFLKQYSIIRRNLINEKYPALKEHIDTSIHGANQTVIPNERWNFDKFLKTPFWKYSENPISGQVQKELMMRWPEAKPLETSTIEWADAARTPQITAENAASITPEQWTAAQDAANATPEVTHFYHGSPVRFDAFSADFIGSGEGGSKVMLGINLWPEEKIANAPKLANIKSPDAPLHLGVSSTPLGGELNPTVYDVSGRGLKLYTTTPRGVKGLSQSDLISQGYDGIQTPNQVTVFPESIGKLSIDKQSTIDEFILSHPEVERWTPWTTDTQKMQNIIDMSKMSKWTPEQWTAAQDAAIAKGDMAEAQRLRDLHFRTYQNGDMVDVNGNPIHVYHGSPEENIIEFYKPNDPRLPAPKGINFKATGEEGIYTSPRKGYAANYMADLGGRYRVPLTKEQKALLKAGKTREEIGLPSIPKGRLYDLYSNTKLVPENLNIDFNPFTLSTKEAKLIKSKGYTGFNISGKKYPEHIVLEPNQLKLADAVTYDDNGVRIPLGERDNFNINDIRYGLLPFGIGLTGYGLWQRN